MNERRALERERWGQMTSPEQRRQRDAARRSLNNIPQPQFQGPSVPPLHRGGAYYPGLHAGFIPNNVAQPLPMHNYPNLPRNAVAHHQRNVGNHQALAAAYGAQNWNEFNQRFQQEYQQRQTQRAEFGTHGQPSNQNHHNGGWVDHTRNLIEGTNQRHEERSEARRQNRRRGSSAANENFINLQQQNLQRGRAEQLRARNALQRAEAQRQQHNIDLNEVQEHQRRQAQAAREIQDALAQQFHDEVQERRENFIQRSQELRDEAERARLRQLELQNQQLPPGCRPYAEPNMRFSLGNMNVVCPECGALHFESEKLTSSTRNVKKFGLCCLQGKVTPPGLNNPPDQMLHLLTHVSNASFREKIRQYNAAFAFTSVGVKLDESITRSSGPYAFKIHGALYHRTGALVAEEGQNPSYAQLYILDPEEALNQRAQNNLGANGQPLLDGPTMQVLHDMLHEVNPYINLYKYAYQTMSEKPPEEQHTISMRLVLQQGDDQRRYNLPTVTEIAAIIPARPDAELQQRKSDYREIALRMRGGGLSFISQCHPMYTPLHYVLLFPRGETGWHPLIPMGAFGSRSAHVTARCYYAYRLHQRANNSLAIFYAGRLFQQYVVDAWATTEQSALDWICHNQTKLRADLYKTALQNIEDDVGAENRGDRIILPSSHLGSPRHMFQLFQDSMAICRYCRKPDLFITMTANPQWPEIHEALLEYAGGDESRKQRPEDRPDIIARIFEEKKKALLKEIQDGLFGEVIGHVHTTEFQKRGLPHIHILVFLAAPHKIHDVVGADRIVSAQFPNPETEPLLYATVTKTMVHGPCGRDHPHAKCMVNGACSKWYPKDFLEHTLFGEDGYPQYARPNNGRVFTNHAGHTYTNHDVPHNPYLSAKYDCHINVEVCASIKAVKYIHKYIYKGPDMATVRVGQTDEPQGAQRGNNARRRRNPQQGGNAQGQGEGETLNEVEQYLSARYIGPVEACWRLFEFAMHLELPSVYRLPVHLEDEQQVIWHEGASVAEQERAVEGGHKTHLTQWFTANATFPDAANYTYQEFPQHFVWVAKQKIWKPRERGFAIGRIRFVHPAAGETFYLRLLLTVIKGAKSWNDLKLVDGVQHPTFQAACVAMGLLQDDGEWNQCLAEAGEMQTGSQLRRLFAMILLNCRPTSPHTLWDTHRAKICDDLARTLEREHPHIDQTEEIVYDFGLYLIEKILLKSERRLRDFPEMPQWVGNWDRIENNFILQEQLQYDVVELQATVQRHVESFNAEQRAVYDAVMAAVQGEEKHVFFLHRAGGGGKTYVCNTIAAAVRARRRVALCVASLGIASLLLNGGRTSHSRFHIPINIDETSRCKIKRDDFLHRTLELTDIIIWDEAPMQHRFCIDAVDRTLREILGRDLPFGGINVLFGGDFRQTLPVVPKGSREQIISAPIRQSSFWPRVQLYHLTANMRLDRTPESEIFAHWLLQVGAGRGGYAQSVPLDQSMIVADNTVKSLVDSIYPNLTTPNNPDSYFLDRTILCCRNDDVDAINQEILDTFPGEEVTVHSIDRASDPDEGVDHSDVYPVEFLNSLVLSGLPLAHLKLKKGCPLMLLRNLDPSIGLCNGTRLILKPVRPRVLECRILGGKFAGASVFIPRITLKPSDQALPLPFSRHQFPVRLAFAMTVNKSQGQSVKHVGLDLRVPVFSHGQLYVALSRCTSKDRIKILLPTEANGRTPNIVYQEVLNGIVNGMFPVP